MAKAYTTLCAWKVLHYNIKNNRNGADKGEQGLAGKLFSGNTRMAHETTKNKYLYTGYQNTLK